MVGGEAFGRSGRGREESAEGKGLKIEKWGIKKRMMEKGGGGREGGGGRIDIGEDENSKVGKI